MILSSSPHKKTTHSRNTWHSYHLHLIVPAVVARKESASIQIGLDPEEDALYSKAPDEDTLILSRGILLSMELRKNINACRLNVAWGTDRLETTIVI
jgi:hypothetical protein